MTTSVPTTPIATMPSSIPGITLQLYSAQRTTGGAVLVVFGLDYTDAASVADGISTEVDQGLSANNDQVTLTNSVSAVSLVDPTGLKQYQTDMSNPARDQTCMCSEIPNQDAPGTAVFAALLAAPPASVTSVSFVTGLGTFGNVSLSR